MKKESWWIIVLEWALIIVLFPLILLNVSFYWCKDHIEAWYKTFKRARAQKVLVKQFNSNKHEECIFRNSIYYCLNCKHHMDSVLCSLVFD